MSEPRHTLAAKGGRSLPRFWPLLLIAAGLFLLLAGFVYFVMFAGIPYQDPPPELAAEYDRHVRVASTIADLGLGASLAGLLAGIILLVARQAGKKR